MQEIKFRDLLGQLRLHPTIDTLLLMGGNTKNGPEFLLRRYLKGYDLKLRCQRSEVPREHQFPYAGRVISTVSLTSPSNAANRAIGSTALYKRRKNEDSSYTTGTFRVEQYRKVFCPDASPPEGEEEQ